ncbi:MAG: hypothetical protein DHS20C06_10450 [Hyphobacterium sp.]|nr:MAG: hypothetical protein DHS20C06_10450 [Hyphobacterium sp.]
MHIALGLLGLLAAIGAIAWRINMAMKGAEVIKDVAQTTANLPRKMRFKAKANRQKLSAIDDPREAAAVLLLGMARAGGEVTKEHKQTIRSRMEIEFGVTPALSEEFLARASWHSANVADPADLVPRKTDFLAKQVGAIELAQVSTMLDAVANVEAESNPDQIEYFRRYRQKAGLI